MDERGPGFSRGFQVDFYDLTGPLTANRKIPPIGWSRPRSGSMVAGQAIGLGEVAHEPLAESKQPIVPAFNASHRCPSPSAMRAERDPPVDASAIVCTEVVPTRGR